MPQERFGQIPQELRDIFVGYGLELPPLPKNALSVLARAGGEMFATDAPPHWLLQNTPTSLSFSDLAMLAPPAFADSEENAADNAEEEARDAGEALDEVPYFLCGFSGRRLQDRVFLYLHASRRLRLGIVLPFNRAYADPEQERRGVVQAVELLTLLLHCTREGANLNVNGPGTLFWTHDRQGSSFQACAGDGEIIAAGASADDLMRYLEGCRDAVAEETVENRFWLSV